MNYELEAFGIETLFTDLDEPSELRNQHLSEHPSEQTHRARLRAAGLKSGRVEGWTRMSCEQLWREWRRRFADDDGLALDALLDVADRLARDRSPRQQEVLRRLKRVLLGDAYSETEYVDPVPARGHARVPLPVKGVVKALKHVARKRAGVRPWER